MNNTDINTDTTAATPAETMPETATETKGATPAKPAKVVAKLFMGFKKPIYITGMRTNNRVYEMIATQVSLDNGQVHDLVLDLDRWDEVAAAACPSATVLFSGTLVHEKNPYWVNSNSTDPTRPTYERLRMNNPDLVDIIDTKGSAIAFRRGARLPTSETLKQRYLASIGVEAAKSEDGIETTFTEAPKGV